MRRFLLVMLAALVAVSVPALAASSTKLKATLNGKSEVPKTTSKATGKATFTIASNGKSIKYTLSAKNLTGPVVASHVHFGKKGKAGPVIIPICPKACTLPKSGTLTKKNFTKAAGVSSFAAAVKAMKAGNTYVNIHTKKFPAGEIRGQIKKSS
jgi:hypothetical protein